MNDVLLEDYINNLYGILEIEDQEITPEEEKTGEEVQPVDPVKPGKKPITRAQLLAVLKGKRGKMLSIAYRKKDGSLRLINTVTGVQKNITGSGLKYDPEKYGYFILYDLKKKGYRTVNLNTVGDIKMDRQVYTLKESLDKSPLRFRNGGIDLEGESAWNHWKRWMNINRTDKFVSDVLDTIKRQNYQTTAKQFKVLVNWFNSKR